MADSDLLRRWCRHVGISPGFDDIWGKRHDSTDDGLRALLAELGVLDPSEDALAASVVATWREILPPVVSIVADEPVFEVAARVPPRTGGFAWTLTTEDGQAREGRVDASDRAVVDQATVDGEPMVLLRLAIAGAPPPGYHRFALRLEGEGGPVAVETLLVAAPARCYRPPALQGDGRVWGPSVQLHSLRSDRNWGIGDFSDLAWVAEDFGGWGAGLIGVNPLHALFAHEPRHLSPYSPSSRALLNVLYIDVEAIPEMRECDAALALVRSAPFQHRLASLRRTEHVDHVGVAAAKFEVLRLLYAHFRERHVEAGSAHAAEFRRWLADGGDAVASHATFEALQARFHAVDSSVWGWPKWPAEFRDPSSDAVREFRASHAPEIEYHAWLQWQAEAQLARVGARCRERGLAVGLYLDLAVSVDRGGSESWSHAALFAPGASVGAPPDELSLNGQDWGLPPLKPRAMLHDRMQFFRATLRACMRHAGALRIDHVMGLMRLYWIPPGQPASAGAYVHYALRELMAVVALESLRNGCMVIGEDLGTVADEMRAALARHEVLSYRLFYFERDARGDFKPSADYPLEALVGVGTHDLPTLAGWWRGHDIDVRDRLGLYPDAGVRDAQRANRAHERERMLAALAVDGLAPEGLAADPAAPDAALAQLSEAVHAYIAGTPSRVMMVQLEDALGLLDQANLPGTVDQYPNWRQKLPVPVEQLLEQARVRSLCARLARIRPHAPPGIAPDVAAPARGEATVPGATYRLQFHAGFTFDHAVAVLPHLARLGVSHVYCSPLTRANPGSLHGYDVVAFDEINPELGGRAGFDRFVAAARAHGLRLLLDMVPNHMGIGVHNCWWMDVLENGPASPWARFFDIDWHPADAELEGKVLLPVLGAHFGQVLDGNELRLAFEAGTGGFVLRYWEHGFPVDPRTTAAVLERAGGGCDDAVGSALRALAAEAATLPPRDEADADTARREAAHRARGDLKRRLAALASESPAARQAIEDALASLATPDFIDALHEAQAWRLAFWRVASDEINYRRFFDVNELAALRMEDRAVFEATHAFVLELAAAGLVDGLRIDHPDGLHDPAQYFDRLQQGYASRAGLPPPVRGRQGRTPRPLYVVAEKITAAHEEMPDAWAVHGTTGYEFANLANGVLVDATARERIDRVWRRFSGDADDFAEQAYEGRRAIMRGSLASELTVLADTLLRIARADRHTRDYTGNALHEALSQVAACMPVYRTYIVREPSAQDQQVVDWAIAKARRRSPTADASIFDFVRCALLGRAQAGADAALAERVRRFAMRFQQFTSPVAAKGVEDTAFYRYQRLLPLNEVGGDPGIFGVTVRGFHAANAARAARWPHTLLATSTHDNKRSEDVRCRLDVLSEMPAAWRGLLRRVSAAQQLQRLRIELPDPREDDGEEGGTAVATIPSSADEYLLVQTLLGTLPAGGLDEDGLPAYRERIERAMIKSVREAKRHTSWIAPDAAYEDALLALVRSLLARVRPNPLLTELQSHAESLAWFGALNSASLVVAKLTAPGVPDIYQGNESIDLSLVDPDNRRPVDYAALESRLDALEAFRHDLPTALRELLASPHDGRLKLWITWRLLQLRRGRELLFRDGGYAPLRVVGERSDHVVGFVREARGERVVALFGRLFAKLSGDRREPPLGEGAWGDTRVELPAGLADVDLVDELSGRTAAVIDGHIRLAQAFASLPFAVLVSPSRGPSQETKPPRAPDRSDDAPSDGGHGSSFAGQGRN